MGAGGEGGAVYIGRGGINGVVIAKADAIVREFVQRWGIFFGHKIGAHAVPNDENDVTRIRSWYGCHHRGGLTEQSRDYDQKEFSQASFQQRDFRLKKAGCHCGKIFSITSCDRGKAGITDAGYNAYSRPTRPPLQEGAAVVACQRRTGR